MDFLHGGVTGCAGLVIACSEGGGGGGGGEGEGDSIEEADNILRACACAFSGGRLSIIERLRLASEDFRILLRFKRNRIALSLLAYLVWLIAVLTTSSALDSFD
jgi:hypothetical protein